jgi:hypothetical protein
MSKTKRTRPNYEHEWDSGPREDFAGDHKRRDRHRAKGTDKRRRAGPGRVPNWLIEQAELNDDLLEYGRLSTLRRTTR